MNDNDLESSVAPSLGVEVVVEVDVAGDADDATEVDDDLAKGHKLGGVLAELLVRVHTSRPAYPGRPEQGSIGFH